MNPFSVIAVVAAGAAAFTDLRTGNIPNRISLGALCVGLAGSACLPLATGQASAVPGSMLTALGGAILCGIAPFVLWRARALGGGDVKMFLALGALLGPMLGLEAQMMAFASGALIVPFRLAWEGRLFATLARSGRLVTNAFVPGEKKKPIDAAAMTWFRLGPMIFAGTVLALLARGFRP